MLQVMKLDSENAKLRESYFPTHPPVAMRTFFERELQPGVDKVVHSGPVGAWSYNHSRFGLPQGLYVLTTRAFPNV